MVPAYCSCADRPLARLRCSKPKLGRVVRWSPLETQLLASVRAIPQVHVDEGLVGHSEPLAKGLEIAKGLLVDADSDRFLQPLGVRITASLGKVVVFSH